MKKEDTIEFYKEIGKRIANFRKKQNLSQAEFAQKLNVQQQVIANYEIARRRIPVSFLVEVAEALSVDIVDLIETKKTKKRRIKNVQR